MAMTSSWPSFLGLLLGAHGSVTNLSNLLQPPLRGLVLSTFGAGNAPDNNEELVKVLE